MKEFIESVSARLGISEGISRNATGGLLGYVREKIAPKDFGELLGALPGAADLLGELPASQPAAVPRRGGLWDTMAGKALTAVGAEDLGSGLELAGRLKELGLTGNQIGSLISMFGQYGKEQAGSGSFKRIISKVPEIKRIVG